MKQLKQSLQISIWEDYEFKLNIPHNFEGSNKPFIFYYYKDENTNKLVRIRKYLGKHKGDIKKIKAEAKEVIEGIIELLKGNWNPVSKDMNIIALTPNSTTIECIDTWIKSRETAYEQMSIKKTTLKNNKIVMAFLKDYLGKRKLLAVRISAITNVQIREFLDEKTFERNWGKVTYNTYKIDLGTFFNYLLDLGVIKNNPIRKVPKKSTKFDSSRFKVFEMEELHLVSALLANDKSFRGLHMAAKLLFKYNIRPVEITRIKVSHIDWNKKLLTLNPDMTKNGNEARFMLDEESISMLRDIIGSSPQEYFVFGGWNKPSLTQMHCDFFGQRWRIFREKYNIDQKLKFYALKHSSNYYDIESGASFEEIRHRNRHANLQVTTLYIKERLFKNVIKPSNSNNF